MKATAKRPIAILLIIAIALAVGFAADRIWLGIERLTHPRDYQELIETYSREYNVPEYLIAAVIKIESGYDPYAESKAGARGLMQMMPATFEWLTGEEHLCEFLPKAKLFDPETSIKYGVYYLRYLQSKFYNWDTVLAAYNGGEGNVAKWLADPAYSDGNGNLTKIPFEETENYVRKVNAAMDTYKKLYEKQEKTEESQA